MMRSVLKALLILMVFSIEVRVHALSLVKSCASTNEQCYLFAETNEIKVFGQTEYRIKPATAVKKISENKLEIVAGKIAIQSDSNVLVKSLYGEALINKGSAIIEVDRHSMKIISLSPGVYYRGRGQASQTSLKQSLYVEVGRVNQSGTAEVNFPHSIEKKELISNWATYYKKSESIKFSSKVKTLAKHTPLTPHELSHTYLMTVRREQASLDQRREAERRRRAKYLEETEYLRNLFRKKNYIDYSSY